MSTDIPSDLQPFVQRMLSERRYLSESDLVAEGLRLLQAKEAYREEIRKGFDELDAGQSRDADSAFLTAESRINQMEKGSS